MKAREEKIGRLTLSRNEQGEFTLSRTYESAGEPRTQTLSCGAADAPAIASVGATIQSMDKAYQKDRKEGVTHDQGSEGKNAPLRKERVGQFDVAQFENKNGRYGTFAGYSVERSYIEGTDENGKNVFRTERLNVTSMDAPSFAMAGSTAQAWAREGVRAEESSEQAQELEQAQ